MYTGSGKGFLCQPDGLFLSPKAFLIPTTADAVMFTSHSLQDLPE